MSCWTIAKRNLLRTNAFGNVRKSLLNKCKKTLVSTHLLLAESVPGWNICPH